MLADPTRATRAARAVAYQAAGTASRADWRSTLARGGLVAKGVLYGALGWLAVQMASGDAAGDAATKRGAIELVASQPMGQLLLGLLTFGLFALAIWQIILVVTGDPVDGREPSDRAAYAGKAFIYLGTAGTSFAILAPQWGLGAFRVPGSGGGDEASQDRAAAMIMSWPGGRWIVAAIGLAVVVFAVYQFLQHGMDSRFMQRLDRGAMRGGIATHVERAGRWGYSARAVAFAIMGVFFLAAAIQHDPSEAVGLSGALQAMAAHPWVPVVLWAVAVGLVLYGGFCIAEAKYRRAA
jgi:hypothetical protein